MKKTFIPTGNPVFDAAMQKMDNPTRQNHIRGIRSLMLYYQKLPEDC